MSSPKEVSEVPSNLRSVEEDLRHLSASLTAIFINKAGPRLQIMLEDLGTTKALLKDPDPNVRCAAMSVLIDHWKSGTEAATFAEHMAFADPEMEVRAFAVTCLGSCYSGTNDKRIGQILAGVVYNEDQHPKVREAAYRALFHIRGSPVRERPSMSRLRFPEDADWSFVKTFF
jgi:hypothetical protein